MRSAILLVVIGAMSGCANSPVGANRGECEEDPAACRPVSEAYRKSNGAVLPPPSDAALQRGEAMRVWVAPMRSSSGVLTGSGLIYVETQ